MRDIRRYLERTEEQNFSLEVIDVSKQPYLAEHFKLIATPTLIKLYPEPRQMLAGSNLVLQLERYWSRWQRLATRSQHPEAVPDRDGRDAFTDRDRPAQDAKSDANPDANPNANPNADIAAIAAESIDLASDASPVERIIEEPTDSSGRSMAIASEVFELSDRIFQLEKENRDLEVQLKFKDRLMSVLAHDLRNPLTAISIALETLEGLSLQSKLDTRPELTAQLFRHARTQSRQIERMISDILKTSIGNRQNFQIVPQELDLDALCREVLNQQHRYIQRKQHQVCTDIPQDLPHAYADRDRIHQLLCNLIDNAVKYTPEGGTLGIAILHRTSDKLQISISDTGPGIPLETQTQIFEDRFRLNRDEETDGYGLGLALCQRIVRAHYGRIWVDSRPEYGSTFHFTLPVYRQ